MHKKLHDLTWLEAVHVFAWLFQVQVQIDWHGDLDICTVEYTWHDAETHILYISGYGWSNHGGPEESSKYLLQNIFKNGRAPRTHEPLPVIEFETLEELELKLEIAGFQLFSKGRYAS